MLIRDFNEEAKRIHELNARWWIDLNTGERIERDKAAMLMLVSTELAEAAEGERKNLFDDHLPHRLQAEVELADALIRILDFAGGHGYKFEDKLDKKIEWVRNMSEFLLEEYKNKYNLGKEKLRDLFALDSILHVIYENLEDEKERTLYLSGFVFSIYFYSRIFGYDLEGAYIEKLEYNKTRKDHSIEERLKPNGKKL